MLTLIIPGLIWPPQTFADLTDDLPLPAIKRLLRFGRFGRIGDVGHVGHIDRPPANDANHTNDAHDTLARHLGYAITAANPLPAAALRRLALTSKHDAAEWLCLDPISLRFDQRALIVDDPLQLGLTAAESTALTVSLVPTLEALGELEMTAPARWHLRLNKPAPPFESLAHILARSARPLPRGDAYRPWQAAIDEAQFVLHNHPVNHAREAAGIPLINSLWPWGGGRLKSTPPVAAHTLYGGDTLAQGMAMHLKIPFQPLPSTFANIASRNTTLFDTRLEEPMRRGEGEQWRQSLITLEALWLQPALKLLQLGKLDGICVLLPHSPVALEITLKPFDLLKFWRSPVPVARLATPDPSDQT